jgi:hypothetical protein
MIINKYATFTESQDVYQKKMNEKLEEGVVFTTEEFIQKLKMVGNEQRVLYREAMPEEDSLVILHDEIDFKTETDLNNFLVKKNQETTKEIHAFIVDNSRFKNRTREIREIEDILKLDWKNVESVEGFYNNISFLKKDRRETLNIVRETESSNTFLFWADSPEGEKFYNDNYNKIASAIKEQQVKPWLNYEYRIEKK